MTRLLIATMCAARLSNYARLPDRPLRWVVVDDGSTGTAELWRTP